ncbi:MAG: DNA (cytosine-5-)-methyltransferase [Sulfurovaceae bacterium]|nr:DNA (cytosine-5-)-methyltransferase [Sulfurovaceae bacterium]
MKFGSICSGIEAASLSFGSVGIEPSWFSEISDFPSSVLTHHYPTINNHGDMNNIPNLVLNRDIDAPEILCGGTPCQAFSLAGLQEGLTDSRGQLTLKFIEIADAIDTIRVEDNKKKSIILWENVEGVLRDKTNAFGHFIAGLSGLEIPIEVKKWSSSGILYGKTRNIAWRVLDAKFFGLPQQRKRLFVIATDTDINPELILFEKCTNAQLTNLKNLKNIYSNNISKETLFSINENSQNSNIKLINGEKIEVFRQYTDCLYSAYGTKWNGNAAAYNGSLYISQNDKVRRLTPLECERIMGFPDNYTNIPKSKDTSRYQAIGNSWAIPTVTWLAKQINSFDISTQENSWRSHLSPNQEEKEFKLYLLNKDIFTLSIDTHINCSVAPNNIKRGEIFDIIDTNPSSKLFISSKGTDGILRRKNQRNINMNRQLELLFLKNNDVS